jgi:hypothetical protein
MLFFSDSDLQVEQIFRVSTFCPLIVVLIIFPDADGFFKSFLNQIRSQIEQACPNLLILKLSLKYSLADLWYLN